MAEEQTEATVQDPTTPDPTVVASVAAPTVQTPAPAAGPWSADLAQSFEDEQQRAAVDAFLREKVQPYTTRLEQQAHGNEQALNLWNQFESDPINTYVQVTHELLGEELANEFLEFAQQRLNGQEQQPEPTQEAQPMALSPEDQAVLNWAKQEQAKSFYNDELSRVMSQPENQDLVNAKGKDGSSAFDHIAPFVQSAGGDFDQATAMLRTFVNQWGVPQTAAMPEVPDPPAPNVFGSDTATSQASTTPVQQPPQTLDGAIDDFMKELREGRAAPPMGAV